nr:MAG TPA: hypothetical protein [Caudoviricetes sp.]
MLSVNFFGGVIEQFPRCYPLPRPPSPRRNLYAPIKAHLAACW